MEIEIYTDEVTPETIAPDEARAHHTLSEGLGLDLQIAASKEGAAHPIPVRPLNKEEKAVYEKLFDQKASLERYSEPIPTRVLMVIQIGVENQWWTTDQLYVRWASTTADPVLMMQDSDSWSSSHRMIARWGDALASYADLRREAARIMAIELRKNAREKLRQLQDILDAPEQAAEEYLLEGRTYTHL
jgi:hypothetical protein